MLKYLRVMKDSGMVDDDRLRKWAWFGVIKNTQTSITGRIYDESDNDYFSSYVNWIENNDSNEVPEYLVPLNPPPVT